MEFLIGRTLGNALAALDLHGDGALRRWRCTPSGWRTSAEQEPDAALGNGGLGRLAACFLDSMATLGLPSFGYGIRYEYGMFAQDIVDGRQVEHPDPWLADGTPWEFPRAGVQLPGALRRLGRARRAASAAVAPGGRGGRQGLRHGDPGPRHAQASARCGCGRRRRRRTSTCMPSTRGDYARAAEVKNEFENISWVLYPNDSTPAGRELRLRQEYFFVAASMQDIVGAPPRRAPHAWPTWPTRWRSTSTTPIRRSAWPS